MAIRTGRASIAQPMIGTHARWRDWTYFDLPLFFFVGIMIAAASITSHGTYVFYSYILPQGLAIAATIVLTAGSPLLELASVLDKKNKEGKEATQWRYLFGLCFLLLLEALAQYYQGQAGFVGSIKQQWAAPAGVDLATFALESRGRLLPMLYLAALSGVVVYFGYAASARIRDLRKRAKRLEDSVITPEQHAALQLTIQTQTDQLIAAAKIAKKLEQERDEARETITLDNTSAQSRLQQATEVLQDMQAQRDEAQRIAKEEYDRAETWQREYQQKHAGDTEIVEALASGEWPLSRIADELAKLHGGPTAAAKALGTSHTNIRNWRQEFETTMTA